MKFDTPELQEKWNEYQAKMNSPEVVAKARASLIEERKRYWGSILFLVPVVMLTTSLTVLWLLIHFFHADLEPAVWVFSIGLPVLVGMALYPRN